MSSCASSSGATAWIGGGSGWWITCLPGAPARRSSSAGIKGKAGGKAGGKGMDLPRLDPEVIKNMATTAPPTARYPQGQPICRNYHISYCPGWCGRSHNVCPKKLADGTHSFGHHSLQQCTRT